MHPQAIDRRKFIQYASVAFGGLLLRVPAPEPRLSFSTLGCPEWDLPQILQFAKQHGYGAIELRGIGKDMFLPDSPYLQPAQIDATKRMIRDSGLKVIGLGSSAQLHHPEADWTKHLDEARKYIDLAARLDCPYVRVFPEKLPQGGDRNKTMDTIATRLRSLAEHARGSKVTVLLETHGDLVASSDIRYVLDGAGGRNTGVIWDVVNMWSVTKEAPADAYRNLKPFIRHVHLKDVVWRDGKMQYVLFGAGEAPVRAAVDLLVQNRYKGYYSFEWEKRWHPEIEAPEKALAQYPDVLRSFFRKP